VIWFLQLLHRQGERQGRRRQSTAEVTLRDPEQARRLLRDPHLWQLWMPGVGEVVDASRAPRTGARYAVRLSLRVGRLGFGDQHEGHVVIESIGTDALAWQLLVGTHVERYQLVVGDAAAQLEAQGEAAADVLARLERESAP
jgi:hypothetical protein